MYKWTIRKEPKNDISVEHCTDVLKRIDYLTKNKDGFIISWDFKIITKKDYIQRVLHLLEKNISI